MIRRRILTGLLAAPAVLPAGGLLMGLPAHRPAVPWFRSEALGPGGEVLKTMDWWRASDGAYLLRGVSLDPEPGTMAVGIRMTTIRKRGATMMFGERAALLEPFTLMFACGQTFPVFSKAALA